MSPFSSPPNSHGSTRTVSPSLTHRRLLNLPGILHRRIFPSRHLTLILVPPRRWSTRPNSCWPRGSFVLPISASYASLCSSTAFLRLMRRKTPSFVYKVFYSCHPCFMAWNTGLKEGQAL